MFNIFKRTLKQDTQVWALFEGQKNTDEVLTRKAKLLALMLVRLLVDGAKDLQKQMQKSLDKEMDDKNYFAVTFVELMMFMLHFIDRVVFQTLKHDQRDLFMDVLVKEVRDLFVEAEKSTNAEFSEANFRSTFADFYNKRQTEYTQYKKLYPTKDEGMKDTLLWEASKNIAGVFGAGNDAFGIAMVQVPLLATVKVIELPLLLKEN